MSHSDDVGSMALCRTCLGTSDLLPLFPVSGPSARARLQYDLRRATGLPISMDDGLPQKICRICTDLVCSALYLQDQSLLSEQKLLNVGYKIKQEIVQYDDPSLLTSDTKPFRSLDVEEEEEEEHYNEENPIDETKKNIDTQVSSCVASENEMFSADSQNETNSVICNQVDLTNKNENNIEDNPSPIDNTGKEENVKKLKLIAKMKVCEEYSDGPLKKNGPIRCKKCKRLSKCLSSFYFHVRIHNGFRHVCEFCGKKFYASIGLKRHCMSWHGLEKELSCTECHYQATSSSRLKEHERTHTGEKPYECAECGVKFHSRSSILQHLRTHENRTLKCDKCPSMFKSRRALTTHVNHTHIRDYVYLCYMCDMRYSKNSTARNHLTRIHGIARNQQGKIPRFSRSKSAIVN